MRLALSTFAVFFPGFAFAGDCGQVTVDCRMHMISIQGTNSTINCGKGTFTNDKETATLEGEGTIGGEWVPDLGSDPIKAGMGVDIEGIPGMGKGGGGKIFHILPGGGKINAGNDSKGCIRIDSQVLNKLKQCQGSKLKIQNAMKNDGTGGMSSSSGKGGGAGGQGGQGGQGGGDKGKGQPTSGTGFQGFLPYKPAPYPSYKPPANAYGREPWTAK
jgi:hypothetical protein